MYFWWSPHLPLSKLRNITFCPIHIVMTSNSLCEFRGVRTPILTLLKSLLISMSFYAHSGMSAHGKYLLLSCPQLLNPNIYCHLLIYQYFLKFSERLDELWKDAYGGWWLESEKNSPNNIFWWKLVVNNQARVESLWVGLGNLMSNHIFCVGVIQKQASVDMAKSPLIFWRKIEFF